MVFVIGAEAKMVISVIPCMSLLADDIFQVMLYESMPPHSYGVQF